MSNTILVCSLVTVITVFVGACSESQQAAQISAGELIVKKNCKVCHAQGINGAPIIGNKKMWGPRVTKGIPELVENAANGFGLMPAKGGNTELSKAEIEQAVIYMTSQIN